MKKKKFTIFAEDYNVPLMPWGILIDHTLGPGIAGITDGRYDRVENMFYFKKDYVVWGPDEDQFKAIGDYFNQLLIKDEKYSKIVEKKHQQYFSEVDAFVNKILSVELSSKTNNQLFRLYEEYYVIFCNLWLWAMVIQFLDMGSDKYSDRIKNNLKSKLAKIGNPEVVFSKLITPVKNTTISLEQEAILDLAADIKADKISYRLFLKSQSVNDLPGKLRRKFDLLSKKFGWLQYYFIGPAADASYYFEYIKRITKKDPKIILLKNKKEKELLVDFQNKYRQRFTTVEQMELNFLKTFLYLKEARKEVQFHLNFAMHGWHAEVGRRFGWSALQTCYIFKEEFYQLLVKNKKSVETELLNQRYNSCAFAFYQGKRLLLTGKAAEDFAKQHIIEEPVNRQIKEFIGTVAFAGKATGIVKIVNSTKDMNKFNEGDILVSISTNPSLVPAMNKAAAILTNTGGITCHAAIVSRELRVPCIIGTNIATKVLKDGDMVEVDAHKGIIRKI